MKRTPLRRSETPMRRRSKKMAALYRNERAPLVAALFADDPMCEVPGCPRRADDPHEPLPRGRGGSITDPSNVVAICRPHHTEITDTEPEWAYRLGFLRHSWEAGTDPDDLLVPCPNPDCSGGEVLTAGDTNRDYSTGPCPDCGGSGEGLWLPGDPRRDDEEVA